MVRGEGTQEAVAQPLRRGRDDRVDEGDLRARDAELPASLSQHGEARRADGGAGGGPPPWAYDEKCGKSSRPIVNVPSGESIFRSATRTRGSMVEAMMPWAQGHV